MTLKKRNTYALLETLMKKHLKLKGEALVELRYIRSFLLMSYYCFQMNSYSLRGSLDTKTFEIKNLKLKGEAPVELRYSAYKSVNNDYSLNALNHSHIKCEQ